MLTQMIEPIEIYTLKSLVYSLELQITLTKEAQQHVLGGQSACQLDTMSRLHRLCDHHRRLLSLHRQLSMVGASLYEIEKSDPNCKDEPEDMPF